MSDQPPTPPQTPAGEQNPPPPRPKKNLRRRRFLQIGGALLCALILLVALAPTLLSTAPGNALVASIARRQIDGRLKMSGLSVGWFSGTRLREAIVEDAAGIRVVELTNLQTDLTLLDALRGKYDLGDASLRLTLPTVVVQADGSTNLDKVFRLDQTANDGKGGSGKADDQPTELPNLTGSLKLDGGATVQYFPPPEPTPAYADPTTRPSPPPVSVTYDGTKLVFGDDKSLQHTLPLALRVNSTPAGTVSAVGTIDLNSLSNDLPTVREKLDVTALDLDAVSTLLTALGFTDVTLAGRLGGTLSADTATNTLVADFTGKDFAATQRGTGGAADTGYSTKTLKLQADGGFALVGDAPEARRPVVTLKSSTLATDDLAANLSGTFDLLRDSYADFQSLVTDAAVKVDSDFLTANGTIRNLGQFNISFNGDVDAFQKRFGKLVDLGVYDPAGRFGGTLKADRQLGMEFGMVIVAALDVEADGVALDAAATGEEPAKSLRLGKVAFTANGYLPAKSQSVEKLTASFSATDAAGQTLASGGVTADQLDLRRSKNARVSLDGLKLPDYAALQQALAGWVELPEPAKPVGRFEVTASADYDAAANRVNVTKPLLVTLDGRTLASVTADAAATGETTWQVNALAADVDLPAVNSLYESLYGEKLTTKEPADGQVSVRADSGTPLTFDTNDIAKTLAGRVEVAVDNARAQGLTASGAVPVVLKGLLLSVPADAAPLTVNGGAVALAGATLDATGDNTILNLPEPPAGQQLAQNVSINPVLSEVLGKYVNPAFVNAAQASGLLDVQIAAASPLNLTDLTGPTGGKVDLTFSLRDMRLVNPQLKQLTGPYLEQFNALSVPGLKLPKIPVPQNLDTLEGYIADARVGLDNGTADTDISFSVADPRDLIDRKKGDKLTLYPIRFRGGVDLTTYKMRLNVGLPQSLVEKWWPDGLEWAEALKPKNGANFALGGTTFQPQAATSPGEVRSLLISKATDAAKDAIGDKARDRAADEIDKALPDELKGLGDLLRGGKKKDKDKKD